MLKRILVPLDGSDLAEQAIGMAASIARASKASIDLLMVHELLMGFGGDDPTWNERAIVSEQKYLHSIAEELRSGAGVESTQTLVRGAPAELITARAADCGADLIVMTSHGRTGWSRAWIGSVADAVMRASNVPVMMLRPAEQVRHPRAATRRVARIAVPLDGSDVAMEILRPVSQLASCWRARVDLVRVVAPVPLLTPAVTMPFVYLPNVADSEATERVVAAAAAALDRDADVLRRAGVDVGERVVLVSDRTADAIIGFARSHDADLVALATHGRGRSRLFIGSVADKVRRGLSVPVLLHRPRFACVAQPEMSAITVAEQLPALAGVGEGI